MRMCARLCECIFKSIRHFFRRSELEKSRFVVGTVAASFRLETKNILMHRTNIQTHLPVGSFFLASSLIYTHTHMHACCCWLLQMMMSAHKPHACCCYSFAVSSSHFPKSHGDNHHIEKCKTEQNSSAPSFFPLRFLFCFAKRLNDARRSYKKSCKLDSATATNKLIK